QADRELREAEAVVARVREDRVRAQGAVEQADQSRLTLIERIAERLECHPEGLLAASEIDDVAQLPELNAIEERLQRLMRERENMGPVNLRAEQEATDLKEKLESLEVEKNDLIQAIGKLRRGIAELNHEGRERLL
ncbi:MAG: chromosome partitioning protein ParA, partial [Rhodospirillales bacterium]